MKVLITGASGLLGRQVYRSLQTSEVIAEVLGTCFSRAQAGLTSLDLTDKKAVECLLKEKTVSVCV